jgi:chorismate--pyruvate lyase
MERPYRFSQLHMEWNSYDHWHLKMNATQRDWLFDRHSLTRRLRVLCNDEFNVIPLHEAAGAVFPEESRELGIQPEAIGWIREVILAGFGRPWIYARSVINSFNNDGGDSDLLQLGNVSLGSLLFGERPYKRSEIEVCRYRDNCNTNIRPDHPLWARRSLFSRGKSRVLVHEMFLPALWESLGA